MSFTLSPMWSNMGDPPVSRKVRMPRARDLEDLAQSLTSRGASKCSRRDTGCTVERAHEVRQIAEAHGECDLGDRALVFGDQPCRAAQARAEEILVRSDSNHLR